MDSAAAVNLSGRSILVVEDDYVIAADLAWSLRTIGAELRGPVPSVADALRLLAAGDQPDLAILDVNLGNEDVFAVADALQRLSVPFVFVTGYDPWIIPPRFATAPRLDKPVNMVALERTLSGMPTRRRL